MHRSPGSLRQRAAPSAPITSQPGVVAQHPTKILGGHVGPTEEAPDPEVDQRDGRPGVFDQVA